MTNPIIMIIKTASNIFQIVFNLQFSCKMSNNGSGLCVVGAIEAQKFSPKTEAKLMNKAEVYTSAPITQNPC